jgi:hypothetical protein
MDLSKAFDCLPHNLLLLKLENYGVSENSLKLLQSYLTGRNGFSTSFYDKNYLPVSYSNVIISKTHLIPTKPS